MKKFLAGALAFMLLLPTAAASSKTINPALPQLPSPSPHEKVVMLFSTKTKPNRSALEKMIEPFSSIKIRYVFHEVFTGFSIEGERSEVAKLEEKYPNVQYTAEANMYKTNMEESVPFIGADRVRKFFDRKGARLTGKGIKVGIIDTGIDYHHPDLARNYKGGQDFVDGDRNPMESRNKRGMTTLHGTHVAGIIAANGVMKGVAPEAELYAYRALGPGGQGTTDQVLAGIEQAVKDHIDVLNLSLGTDVNAPDLPITTALNKAVERGVIAVTSSGNSGPNLWTVGTPGTASEAISVGASTPPMKVPYLHNRLWKKDIKLVPMYGGVPWNLISPLQMVKGGLGEKKDLKRVSGKIVLIKRGDIPFTMKVKNAQAAGAKAVIIYNNTGGEFLGRVSDEVRIPAAAITRKDGEQLMKSLRRRRVLASTKYRIEKDRLADFSSRGPVTINWGIKPDITAPGVEIRSTVPNGYLSLQGTSMAAPHVAGACAILKQAHPDWTPEEIKAAFMNTAKEMKDDKGQPYHAYEQGAGRIQLDKAVKTETLVMPGALSIGRLPSARFEEKEKTMLIKNVGKEAKNYTFSIPEPQKGVHFELPDPFTLQPGEEQKVTIHAERLMTYPKKADLIDGSIQLSDGKQIIHIPYLYVVNEPRYPRVMGFAIARATSGSMLHYEIYLPGGAEEFGIALYDPATMKYLGLLDWRKKVGVGFIEKQVPIPAKMNVDLNQVFAVAFARTKGREDYQELLLNLATPLQKKGNG
ncbi:S8 family serine peptidase [Falsibacillus albus]|uniref:Peptidase S8 n=1 Tax=Falsibacillus albus TaxID=2478915 RepID=A0A3L7JRT1_9BACI|nr:S8 family serine peptidase [Falsibacillus albus]RLQ93513.1 peptidase S8 [Falsibacillus albus]